VNKIRATVSSEIVLLDLSIRSIERLRFALSYPHPEYVKSLRLKIKPTAPLRFECMTEWPDGSISIPRGAVDVLRKALADDDLGVEFDDHRSIGSPIGPFPTPSTRSYQLSGIVRLESKTQGMVILPCGGGKSRLGVAAIARIGRTTIVLVHTDDLIDQWVKEIRENLGVEPGVVNADHKEFDSPIVVASVFSLAPMLEEDPRIGERFGLVIADECFPAGTMVDDVPIEQVPVGSLVQSFDTHGCVTQQRVLRTFARSPNALVRLHLSDGQILTCTPNHRLWSEGGWIEAGKSLDKEVFVDKEEGSISDRVRVDRVEVLEPGSDGTFGGVCPDGLVYNLEVEHNHTYFANRVAVSNCHHIPAATFQRVLRHLPAKNRLGLSATPDREDGHGKLVDWSFGARLLVKTVKELVAEGHLMMPRLVEIPTEFEHEMSATDPRRLTKLHRAITLDKGRNCIIANLAMWEVQAGETVLLLSNRKDHCRRLGKMLIALGVDARVVVGTTKKTERAGSLDDLRTGSAPIVIATSLADEGLNVERLSRIILAFPERARGKTVQRVGRISRKWEGKDPVIFDIVDPRVDTLVRRAGERKRAYRSIGMDV